MNSGNPHPWEHKRAMSPVRTAGMSVRTASRPLSPSGSAAAPVSRPATDPPGAPRTALVALGCVAVFLTMVVQWPSRQVSRASTPDLPCQQLVQPQAALSRESLLQLLAIPERESAQTVRAVVSEPYCTLPPIEIRAGVASEREVFPLAFDPQTWLVVLYEDGEYAGYAFHVNR